jgi:hypothetical protein
MIRVAHIIVLAAFLAVGIGAPVSFASEPAPTEQKDKKDTNSGKAKTTARRTRRRAWAESNHVSRERSARCAPLHIHTRAHPPTNLHTPLGHLDWSAHSVHHRSVHTVR